MMDRQRSGRCRTAFGWLIGVLTAAALLGACQQASMVAPASPSMRIGADGASTPLAESLLNVYESQLVRSLLTLETSSREAILGEVTAGEMDAAIIFHPLENQSLFDTPIGYVPLLVIIPSNIQVDNVTREDLRAIFMGRVASWSEFGGPDLPIQVITEARETSERLAFDNLVMGEYPVTSAARLAMNGRAAIALVSAMPGAIGYTVSGTLPENTIAADVDGISAALENVQDRRYSLVSAVVFVSKQEPEGQLRAFLDWILSDEGQDIVRRHMVGVSD